MTAGELPPVTVIMPVRNEADFIERSLGAVLDQDYPEGLLDVIVVDGESADATKEVVRALVTSRGVADRVMLMDNPRHTAPSSLNLGLEQAPGDVIARVDGHCVIPRSYIRRVVALLAETGADCVGGMQVNVPVGGPIARAIAIAQSSPAGVGNARFRVGGRGGPTDTVYLGAYAKDVFARVGPFDEELVRNQDDELNLRLRQAGGTVWLDPDLRTDYFGRGDIPKLARQYFQYGLYKVRVVRKRRARLLARQMAPPALVVAIGTASVLSVIRRSLLPTAVIIGPYAAGIGLAAWRASSNERALAPKVFAAMTTLHVSYGAGILAGVWRFGIQQRAGSTT